MKRFRKNKANKDQNEKQKKGLDAIDRVLSTGRAAEGTGDEKELAKLALTLSEHEHEERETPSPEFKREMERRAERGFEANATRKKKRRFPEAISNPLKVAGTFFDKVIARRSLAFGGAAAVIVALAVSVAVLQDSGNNGSVGPISDSSVKKEGSPKKDADESGTNSFEQSESLDKLKSSEKPGSEDMGRADSAPEESGDSTGIIAPTPPPSDSRIAPKEQKRRVERSAELTLEVEKNRIEKVANEVIRVSDRNRGIVLSTNISVGEEGNGQATFDLRVPAERLAKTLRELSDLGNVVLRTQSGLDITQSFVDTNEQLQEARAERKSLLKQLANASTPKKAKEIKQKLETVKSQIKSYKGQLKSLRNRTDYASIDVTVQSESSDSNASDTEDAFDDSLDFIVGVLNFGIRVFAVLLVIAIIIAVVVLPIRWMRKRQRDNTLE